MDVKQELTQSSYKKSSSASYVEAHGSHLPDQSESRLLSWQKAMTPWMENMPRLNLQQTGSDFISVYHLFLFCSFKKSVACSYSTHYVYVFFVFSCP